MTILDSAGIKVTTHSIQAILQLVECFNGRSYLSLLASAASHYDLAPCALMGAPLPNKLTAAVPTPRHEPLWTMIDASGRILLTGVLHEVACNAADQCSQIPGWSSEIRICRQLVEPSTRSELIWDWRHEGPLTLLHHSLGIWHFDFVAVKSHIGRSGMTLEETLRRLDQFNIDDQAELLAGLAAHFNMERAD